MAAQKKEISLLPVEEFERTRLGRFLKWALIFGRWIVIATELVVILCFLSRFKLDYDLTNLGEKIKGQQAIITSFKELESNFRKLQKRLKTIGELEAKQLLAAEILDEFAKTVPFDVTLTSLSVEQKHIQVSAWSLSEAGLKSFINALEESPKFTKISLGNITREKTGKVKFGLRAVISD